MSSVTGATTTEDSYFPSEDSSRPRKHRHHRRHRSPTPESDSDVSPGEVIHEREEREYKKPSRRHRHRHVKETVDTTYIAPDVASDNDNDTDGASTDDGTRRRRKHRHRRRNYTYDDAVSEPESGPDVDDRSTTTSGTRDSKGGVRDRAKSIGESALATLGLEEAYRSARSRSRGRRNSSVNSDEGYDSTTERRARSRSRMNSNSAQAAIIAAAVEAFRARNEPGGLTGGKGLKRVVEAAVASGAFEKFLGRDGRDNDGNQKRHIAEAVIAGLAAQRGVNGPRDKSRSKSRHGPLGELAASGLIAAAGKKALDYQRSRSQSRRRSVSRGRDSDVDSDASGRSRNRSQSVGKALAALGLGGIAAGGLHKDRKERNRRSKRPGIRDDDSSSSDSVSDSDLELDEEGERARHKRLRQKEIIGIALAVIAALHLGHAGYETREKRRERREALETGKITEEEADSMKRKTLLGDAATAGLAVLAAAEAVKSFKKMSKNRKALHSFDEKHEKIEERRRRKALEAATGTAAPPAGEASKYYSQSGYMGPPPGGRTSVPAYPYYPTSGPIPMSRGADSYATKDGRELPVVYPSSITHA